MIILFLILGAIVGFVSGFFGIGGGTIVVPVMLMLGYSIKYAIGISIMQMVFSSIYGTYINLKIKTFDLKSSLTLGFGGFLGALGSGFVVSFIDEKILLIVLLVIQILSILKLLKTPIEKHNKSNESRLILFFIGIFVGLIAISVGIGGSVLIMPILITILHYDIKKAVGIGLFFVIFSSSAGLLSLAYHDLVNYKEGLLIGIGSLFGVRYGVQIAKKIDKKKQKLWLIILCTIVACITFKKLIG